MGHCVQTYTFPTDKTRAFIQNELNGIAEDEGDYRSPLEPIRFYNSVVCNSSAEAEEFIRAHDRGFYDQLAVKYRVKKENAAIKKLKTKITVLNTKLRDEESILYTTTVSSAYVGCKKCGSKLSTQYAKTNYCPLCNNDLRSQTQQKKILSIKDKISKTTKELHDEEAKTTSSDPTYWLVKIEYHV